MLVEGTKARGHPKKTWWDGVKEDMKRFSLSWEDAQCRKKCCRKIKVGGSANPGLPGR